MHWATAEKISTALLKEFPRIFKFAEEHRTCLRKSVGCGIYFVNPNVAIKQVQALTTTHNGPSRLTHVCTNVTGGCGCSHAEPRAILEAYRKGWMPGGWDVRSMKLVMVCTYSPCTNCANIINESGIIHAVCYDILTDHDKRGASLLIPEVFSRGDLEKHHERIAKW